MNLDTGEINTTPNLKALEHYGMTEKEVFDAWSAMASAAKEHEFEAMYTEELLMMLAQVGCRGAEAGEALRKLIVAEPDAFSFFAMELMHAHILLEEYQHKFGDLDSDEDD